MPLGFSLLEDLIELIEHAKTTDEVFAGVLLYLKHIGFDFFTYELFRPPNTHVPMYFSNYPADYVNHYIKKRYIRFDVMVNRAAISAFPFTWHAHLQTVDLSKEQIVVREEGAEAGLKMGGFIPLHGPGPVRAYVSVSNAMPLKDFDNLFKSKRHVLQVVGAYMHERILDLNVHRTVIRGLHLTPRQCEILTWSALGKNTQDVAQIMGLSPSTVKDHFADIYRKLEVNNKSHAIAVAVGCGVVSL